MSPPLHHLPSALVSFKDSERYLGGAATSMVRTNMANTITHIKRFVGRKFSEAGVQEELRDVNFKAVAMDNDEIGVKVRRGGGRGGWGPDRASPLWVW